MEGYELYLGSSYHFLAMCTGFEKKKKDLVPHFAGAMISTLRDKTSIGL